MIPICKYFFRETFNQIIKHLLHKVDKYDKYDEKEMEKIEKAFDFM